MTSPSTLRRPRPFRVPLLVAAVMLLAAACGDSSPSPEEVAAERTTDAGDQGGSRDPVPGDLPFGLRRCQDSPWIAADPSFYRDEPVYVANEQPVEEVRAWAATKPGFEDVWIDRDHNGWIALGFTEGAAERQAELEQEFPDVGVVAVDVTYGNAELEALRDEVFAVMEANDIPPGGGHSVPSGLVSVFVGVLDEETLAPLAEFADRPVCFDGIDPADAVADSPQPTEGDGWRLLAAERTGEPYRTGIATDETQYTDLWALSGVTADRAEVDFETEIVIWFGAVYGSGCEIRMDDVIIDTERTVVHGDFVIPGNPGACNDDANPEAYLVAVERDRLPAGRFVIQLDADDPPAGVPEERTVVDADLTAPGTVATADQIGQDQALFDQAEQGYTIAAGDIIEPGFGARYRLELDCGFEVLGPINDVMWQSVEPDISTEVDPAWIEAADDSGVLLADVLLETDPPRLSVSANGHTEDYEPAAADSVTDCP